jgi:hypothetical protein
VLPVPQRAYSQETPGPVGPVSCDYRRACLSEPIDCACIWMFATSYVLQCRSDALSSVRPTLRTAFLTGLLFRRCEHAWYSGLSSAAVAESRAREMFVPHLVVLFSLHWGARALRMCDSVWSAIPNGRSRTVCSIFYLGHTLLKEGAQPVIIIAGPIADCSAGSRAAPTKGQQNVNRKRAGRPAGPGERCSCSPRTAPTHVSATRAIGDWRRYCQFRRTQRYSLQQQQAIMWPSKEKGIMHDGVGVCLYGVSWTQSTGRSGAGSRRIRDLSVPER